jgi:hypothetical protein
MGKMNTMGSLICKVCNTDRLSGFWKIPLQNRQDNENTSSVSSSGNTLYNMLVNCSIQMDTTAGYFINESTNIFYIFKD